MTPRVTVARVLLPAGREMLEERYDVVEGGLDSDRDSLFSLLPGSSALVADPTVSVYGQVIEAAGPDLRVVANFAVGYDNVDLKAAEAAGVVVTNTPDVLTDATAELAAGLAFAAARGIPERERLLREGKWTGWDPGGFRGIELSGATVGVVGMGRIGTRFAQIIAGTAGRIVYSSRTDKPDVETELGAERMELNELLAVSDLVSVHLAATPENHHLFDRERISRMKPGAILVNTARGSLVDAEAVAEALESGQLGAVGLDVFENEPGVPRCLLDAPRAVLTPHIGSATYTARDEMARTVARNVIAVLDGEQPPNPVTT
ncbi:MAG: 2-hydroxyacid dehydrogenase [Solirubrobacterales bacterium]